MLVKIVFCLLFGKSVVVRLSGVYAFYSIHKVIPFGVMVFTC
jgi:hypothetical protein